MSATSLNATDSLKQPQLLTTILLVEDEPAVREVTREALEMGGYRVLEASGPREAARIANDQSARIDLLLTDVVMPEMSGPELARHIGKSRPGMVTVFMSGYSESEVVHTAAAHGVAYAHIQKPFTMRSLLSRVAQALAAKWNAGNSPRPPQFPSL
jgi:two-component system, cell cycle sensor histidine kinase and response regulator CckA